MRYPDCHYLLEELDWALDLLQIMHLKKREIVMSDSIGAVNRTEIKHLLLVQ